MGDGIYVALSNAARQIETLDTIAENIANASTPAYQRAKLRFREELARAADGSPLRFAGAGGTATDRTPGTSRETGRTLDIVLPKDGFLAVGEARRERYTRVGALSVGPKGEVRAAGAQLLTEDGQPLRIDPKGAPAAVTPDGQLRQGESVIGRIKVVTFARPEAMMRESGNLLSAPPAAGPARPNKEPLVVGALEESNVNVIRELSDLISANRAFEAAQRTIDAFRETDRSASTRLISSQ